MEWAWTKGPSRIRYGEELRGGQQTPTGDVEPA
jgi:hypothetical protein